MSAEVRATARSGPSATSTPTSAGSGAHATGPPADAASSSRPPPGGHPPPRPGAVRHAVGGRVRVDRSGTDSSNGEEGDRDTLYVYIPEAPERDE